jgi:hypothetical protein
MVTVLHPITAAVFKVIPKIIRFLTSALQFVILDVGILTALLQMYALVTKVIQNRVMI